MNKILNKLEALANSWGGLFIKVNVNNRFAHKGSINYNDIFNDGFNQAPFVNNQLLATNYYSRVIAFDPETVRWGDLIHEMGHIFACKSEPEGSEEFDFFGWEYAVAKYIRAPMSEWYKHNANYEVSIDADDDCCCLASYITSPIRNLSRSETIKLIRERVKVALDKKLVKRKDNKLIPLAIR